MRTVGNSEQQGIEVRYSDHEYRRGRVREQFDEIVASGAYVHLEKMNDTTFALIVETPTEWASFWIYSKNERAHIDAAECWREKKEPAGGRTDRPLRAGYQTPEVRSEPNADHTPAGQIYASTTRPARP